MFEPFSSASGTAKLVNFSVLLIILMAWIGCAVGFGADLAKFSTGPFDVKVYQNKLTSNAPTDISFSDIGVGGCDGGGKGFVAMLVFAFLALLVAFPITFARLAGFSFPKVDSMEQSLNLEFILVSVAGFFYFLAVCIWGGACFTKIRDLDGVSGVTGTGFGYVIFCFFVVLIAAVLLFLEKGNSNWQVGSGSGSGRSGTIGGSDYDPHADPQAGYSYQGPSGNAQGGYDQQTSL